MTDRTPPVPPKKWKTALVIWIAIYPTLTLLIALFGEHLLLLPLPCAPS